MNPPARTIPENEHRVEPTTVTTPKPTVSAVVPVYNGARTIAELVRRVEEVLGSAAGAFEIILVNDGSQDESWDMLRALSDTHDSVVAIDLMRNFGQHNALLCGIRAASYDVIVTIDDDLQHPPEEIVKLLALLEPGVDVVYGTPERERHGLLRNLASRITKIALQSTMGAKTASQVSAFRAFKTHLRGAFSDYRSPFVSIDVLLTWGTSNFTSTQVAREARTVGESNYTFGKLVSHALNMMTGFSVLPLQLASLTGFFFTLVGIGTLAFVVGRFLIEGRSVPGFAFLASAISIFSGAQLFALGIIGEYLARMHFRMMERPTYAVRHKL